MWSLTRSSRTFFSLILISWVCVLLRSASVASWGVPQEPRPNPKSSTGETDKQVAHEVPKKAVFSQQQRPTAALQAESRQPAQQEEKRVVPQSSPGQPTVVEIKQTSQWNDPIVVATLVVGTIYLAILFVYIFQLIEMRKATNLAKESADAAKSSADALTKSERAWLGPTRAEISGLLPIPPGPPIYFEVFIVNSGRTPALKVQTNIMARSFPIGTGLAQVAGIWAWGT
jgi:hypothetical protein